MLQTHKKQIARLALRSSERQFDTSHQRLRISRSLKMVDETAIWLETYVRSDGHIICAETGAVFGTLITAEGR